VLHAPELAPTSVLAVPPPATGPTPTETLVSLLAATSNSLIPSPIHAPTATLHAAPVPALPAPNVLLAIPAEYGAILLIPLALPLALATKFCSTAILAMTAILLALPVPALDLLSVLLAPPELPILPIPAVTLVSLHAKVMRS